MTDRLDTIAIFVAVAEHASFAEAARRLGRTPAAVTRAVAGLEDQLRTRLLNRTTRSVALTDDGIRYLEACRRLLGTWEDLQGLEIGSQGLPHGTLNVTAPTMFGRLHVMPAVASFLQRHPRVDVRVLLLDRVVSLVDEGLDVGIRLGALPDSSLRAINVGSAFMAVYGSPGYLARHGIPQRPADLLEHDLISCSALTPAPSHWSFEGAGGVDGLAISPRLIVNTPDAAAEAAAADAGLTFLVSYQVEALVDAGRLVKVLAEYQTPPFPIHIVQPSGRFAATKVRLFVEHTAAHLRSKFMRD